MRATRGTIASLIIAGVFLACAPKDETATLDTTGADSVTAASTPVTAERSAGEILAILNTASDGDIEAGTLAQSKATDAAVKQLAARFVTDHQAMKLDVSALAGKLGVTPGLPSDDDLIEDHRKAMEDLNSRAAGREWDEAYLEHEIAMHKEVIDELDDVAEREQNAEVKALLEKALAGLRAHLAAAEELEKKFGV